MKYKVNLNIADIIVSMKSDFPVYLPLNAKHKDPDLKKFVNFIYSGKRKPDITIDVEIVDELPKYPEAKPLFTARNEDQDNWALFKVGNKYMFRNLMTSSGQVMLIDSTFSKVHAFLRPKDMSVYVNCFMKKAKEKFIKKHDCRAWEILDIVYEFLQVLFMHYLTYKKLGVMIHGVGINDIKGQGILFLGVSGAGKSTTARIWHRYSRAKVLNDERIILRKMGKKFYIYTSPWHGDFMDYLEYKRERVEIKKVFFLNQSSGNSACRLSNKEAIADFLTVIFPVLWDKAAIEKNFSLSYDFISSIPCYKLDFVDSKDMIKFVRSVE